MSESARPAPSFAIGYVMSRFPKLSETFVLREMTQLQDDGIRVEVLPLIPNRDEAVIHDEARAFTERMQPIAVASPAALRAWGRLLRSRPGLAARLTGQVAHGYATRPAELVRALPVLASGALLAERVQQLRLDHLHAHFATYPALAAWVAHRVCGVPYSVTVHAHDIFITQAMLGPKLTAANLVIVISDFNRQFLLDHLGPEIAPQVRVIHCGIRTQEYQQVPVRSEPVTPQRPFRVTCVGSLAQYKGQRYLVEAAARLRDAGTPLQVTLVGDGPDRTRLQTTIDRLGLQDVVFLAGAATQAEVQQLLAATDCYVQPSICADNGQMEGIPVALMEALASGLPVVASNISGIPELVRDDPGEPERSTGWLVPQRDPVALAQRIGALCADPQTAVSRVARGRALVARDFELSQVSAQLLQAVRP